MERFEPFVLDGSVTLAWAFEDEQSPYAEAVLDRLPTAHAVVPSLWPLEVANALLMGERRARITQAEIAEFIDILDGLPIMIDGETAERAFTQTLTLAREHRLTTYDAAYLELAMRRGLPIATLDDPLRQAAVAVGVEIVPGG